jgi:hypothetical protein
MLEVTPEGDKIFDEMIDLNVGAVFGDRINQADKRHKQVVY